MSTTAYADRDDTSYFDTSGFHNAVLMYRMEAQKMCKILNGMGVDHTINPILSEEIAKVANELTQLNNNLVAWVKGAEDLELNEVSHTDLDNLKKLIYRIKNLNKGIYSLYLLGKKEDNPDMFHALPHEGMERDFGNIKAFLETIVRYVIA